MKKAYQKPAMSVVMLGQMSCLMQTSEVDQVSTDVGIIFRGAGKGESRVKGQGDDDWYDDWDE